MRTSCPGGGLGEALAAVLRSCTGADRAQVDDRRTSWLLATADALDAVADELPPQLRDANPLGLGRLVDGGLTSAAIHA